jgi:hypothetical protein
MQLLKVLWLLRYLHVRRRRHRQVHRWYACRMQTYLALLLLLLPCCACMPVA